jgi:cell migration-inducing and hyaluronan-binding protein
VLVENNVTYNNVGHCFFLEDGIETGNQYIHNLGIMTKCHPTLPCVPTNLAADGERSKLPPGAAGQNSKDVLIPSDNTVSTFWITNPDNVFRDNVAAGSDQVGFWIALPVHPTGAFEGTDISKATWPRRMALREFKGNVAHSNFDGLMFDRGPQPDGHFSVVGGNAHIALSNPADANSPQVETVIEDFTGYKSRDGAVWSRGELKTFRNLKLADNAIGYTHASGNLGRSVYTSRVVDSLFVGETDNIGNPRSPAEIAYGRSLPYDDIPDYPIRGYEYYDFRHDVDNVTFVNFQDNATRKTGAISYLMYTSFGISSNNSIERAKFVNAKPVYFPPMERKWGSDNGGSGSWKSAVFHDKDGSVSGVPNSFILMNDGVNNAIAIDDKACEIKPTWNAAVCKGDIGRLSVGGGGRGFGGAPGAAAVRVAAAGPGAARPGGPGNFAFGAGGPPQPPVVLSRNGKQLTLTGETNVLAGSEIKVVTERPSVSLNVRELDSGSSVIFELPGFTTAASGSPQNSLKALRMADITSYYKSKSSLWVKVVSTGDTVGGPRGGTSVQVSR